MIGKRWRARNGLDCRRWHEAVLAVESMSPALARDFVRLLLVAHHLSHLVEDMRLVVSELGTNAVTHAQTPFSVTLWCADRSALLASMMRRPRPRFDPRPMSWT